MGVVYKVLCIDCRVTQDLDKLGSFLGDMPVRDRSEALELSDKMRADRGLSFRAGLLLAFMFEHQGHRVELLNDGDAQSRLFQLQDELGPIAEHPSHPWRIRQDDDVRDEDEEA